MQLHHTLLLHLHEGQRLIDQAGSILVAGCQNRLAAVRAHGVAMAGGGAGAGRYILQFGRIGSLIFAMAYVSSFRQSAPPRYT